MQEQVHGGDKWSTYSGEFPYITDEKGRLLGRNVKIVLTASDGELLTFFSSRKVLEEIYRRESLVNDNITLETRDIKDKKNILVIVEKIKRGTEEQKFKEAVNNLVKGGATLKKDV